jgi:hypothetical protein
MITLLRGTDDPRSIEVAEGTLRREFLGAFTVELETDFEFQSGDQVQLDYNDKTYTFDYISSGSNKHKFRHIFYKLAKRVVIDSHLNVPATYDDVIDFADAPLYTLVTTFFEPLYTPAGYSFMFNLAGEVSDYVADISFSGDNLLSALQKVAEAYSVEFDISDDTITIADNIGSTNGVEIKAGINAKEVSREIDNANVCSRLYPSGGGENLPDKYFYTQLKPTLYQTETKNEDEAEVFAEWNERWDKYTGTLADWNTGLDNWSNSINNFEEVFPHWAGTYVKLIEAIEYWYEVIESAKRDWLDAQPLWTGIFVGWLDAIGAWDGTESNFLELFLEWTGTYSQFLTAKDSWDAAIASAKETWLTNTTQWIGTTEQWETSLSNWNSAEDTYKTVFPDWDGGRTELQQAIADWHNRLVTEQGVHYNILDTDKDGTPALQLNIDGDTASLGVIEQIIDFAEVKVKSKRGTVDSVGTEVKYERDTVWIQSTDLVGLDEDMLENYDQVGLTVTNGGLKRADDLRIIQADASLGKIWYIPILENGTEVSFLPSIDSTFILNGYIKDEEINKAAQELYDKAVEYLDNNSTPKITYQVKTTIPKLKIEVGDNVRVLDREKGIDILSRVRDFEYDLFRGVYTSVNFSATLDVSKSEALQRYLDLKAKLASLQGQYSLMALDLLALFEQLWELNGEKLPELEDALNQLDEQLIELNDNKLAQLESELTQLDESINDLNVNKLPDLNDQLNNINFDELQGTIGAEQIIGETILAKFIGADRITTNHLNVDEIVGNSAWFGKITADHIMAGTITANELNTSSILANEAWIGAITAQNLDTAEILASEAWIGAITTDNIGANQITSAKIAANQILASHIAIGGITDDWLSTDLNDQIDASTTAISDMSNDNKLTPVEKTELKRQWDGIVEEYAKYLEQATSFEITGTGTEFEDYQTAYNALNSYVSPLLTSLTTTSTITGTTLRTKFADYYEQRGVFLQRLTNEARVGDAVTIGMRDDGTGRIAVKDGISDITGNSHYWVIDEDGFNYEVSDTNGIVTKVHGGNIIKSRTVHFDPATQDHVFVPIQQISDTEYLELDNNKIGKVVSLAGIQLMSLSDSVANISAATETVMSDTYDNLVKGFNVRAVQSASDYSFSTSTKYRTLSSSWRLASWYALPAQTERVTGEIYFYSHNGWVWSSGTGFRASFDVQKSGSGNVGYVCLFVKTWSSTAGDSCIFLLSDDFTPYSGYYLSSVPDSYELGRDSTGIYLIEDSEVGSKFYTGCRYYLGLTPVEADININITYS